MGKIYKNQTALRIELDTNIDLSTASVSLIKYKKPSGTEGSFTATVSDTNIYYDVLNSTDLDEDGTWIFWSYVTFTDGSVAPGEPAAIKVYNQSK